MQSGHPVRVDSNSFRTDASFVLGAATLEVAPCSSIAFRSPAPPCKKLERPLPLVG